jgi:hypothetical protein
VPAKWNVVSVTLQCTLSLRSLPPLCSNNDRPRSPYSRPSSRCSSQSQCQLPLNPVIVPSEVPIPQFKSVTFPQSQLYLHRHLCRPANRYSTVYCVLLVCECVLDCGLCVTVYWTAVCVWMCIGLRFVCECVLDCCLCVNVYWTAVCVWMCIGLMFVCECVLDWYLCVNVYWTADFVWMCVGLLFVNVYCTAVLCVLFLVHCVYCFWCIVCNCTVWYGAVCNKTVECIRSTGGYGSSVGIATDYGQHDPGIESRWGRDFSHTSRPSVCPTHPPAQWVLVPSKGKVAGAWCWPTTHS